eukprot:1330882-Amphidinium_carterae.1
MTNEFEIDRRDSIRSRNQANERRQEQQRHQDEQRRQEEQRQQVDQQTEEQLLVFRERHRPTPEAVAARPGIAKALGRQENSLMVDVLSR